MNLYNGELDPQFGEHQQARARSLYEDKDFSKTHTVEVRVEGGEKGEEIGGGKEECKQEGRREVGMSSASCPRIPILSISILLTLPSLPSVSRFPSSLFFNTDGADDDDQGGHGHCAGGLGGEHG